MKKLFTFANVLGVVTIMVLITGFGTPGTANTATSQQETMLTQAGFRNKTLTTANQKKLVSSLPAGKVSAVTYKGKLFYVYPRRVRNQILVGRQAEYNAYARQASKAATAAQQQGQQQTKPDLVGYTHGPNRILVRQFDGFGPMDPFGEE